MGYVCPPTSVCTFRCDNNRFFGLVRHWNWCTYFSHCIWVYKKALRNGPLFSIFCIMPKRTARRLIYMYTHMDNQLPELGFEHNLSTVLIYLYMNVYGHAMLTYWTWSVSGTSNHNPSWILIKGWCSIFYKKSVFWAFVACIHYRPNLLHLFDSLFCGLHPFFVSTTTICIPQDPVWFFLALNNVVNY